ncbi:MAG: DNA mismatch repair protein MutS [Lachnospira sp.]|nr:DNA mismatch repair protein MutS [Lachnospira sp.]MDD5829500.1 DNA mismatch repair protein MutS [Lachnospira sp.]
MAEFSPMMQHYLATKEEYKDCILFYRLGDFYEMFFDDAIVVSKELELTLTGKDCGQEERAPMCGIPFHAAETYINRLVANGHKVAICEQMEDPKKAKGIVKREVIKIVTPGTNLNTQALDETKNNYMMCIVYLGDKMGVSIADYSTGDFFVTELEKENELIDEINKFCPSEIIVNEYFEMRGINLFELNNKLGITESTLDNWYFDDDTCRNKLLTHFGVGTLDGMGLKDYSVGITASGALLTYLYETQKSNMPHITSLQPYTTGKYMIIDSSSRRNLELVETMREKQKRGSLLWVLDKTKTAMGARKLRSIIEQPLIDKKEIIKRQDAIEELCNNAIDREEIREYLNPVYDLERIMTKISCKSANPRDLIAFKNSLKMLPYIKGILKNFKSELLNESFNKLDDLKDLYELIDSAIVEEPPIGMRDGGIIKQGYSSEADELRDAKTKGKEWLAQLETREKERTGIRNLKVKYNKVFGYYLEVTNSFKEMVPPEWVRKQTLTNAERYTTDELKHLEDVILGAEDKLYSLEYDLFSEVREKISSQVARIQQTAKSIALIDVFASLSVVAGQNEFVRPSINEKGIVDIKNGRHPVVEKMMNNDMFVANDTYLDNNANRISIITGPNMAGKSTYMRQTALIVLMAQIGSFVPASSADIGIVDRIFTRVGASDDLASGQSTFMVEMTEVANILRNATKDSLIILDEIGRGTSTFDGLSIAWAVVEHIANTKILGAKTLFATHYHELTELEGTLDGVNNYCIAVKEKGDDIVFLRKIVKGGADRSYGIQVAKLAGVPSQVIERAKELVLELSDADISQKAKDIAQYSKKVASMNKQYKKVDDLEVKQMSLFDTVKDDDIITDIKNMDISNMTPIDALNTLYKLQGRVKNRW